MAKMLRDEDIRLNFIINGASSKKELRELDAEAERLSKSIKGMKSGTQEYIMANKQLDEVQAKQKQLRHEIGFTSLSLKDLNLRAAELRAIKQHLTPGTAEFKKIQAELLKVNIRVRELNTGIKQTGFSISQMGIAFNRYFSMVTAGFASLIGIFMGFRKAVDTFNQFEESVANLSALTGLVGNDLRWLADEAKRMSTAVVEGNIRVKQSADAVADAYMKMGSQRPELLKNKEALAAVTQDAIILSEAAKMKLEPAVAALATVLNQFNKQAWESRDAINILAAGSKYGAANIPYLTTVLERAGTTANIMGVSLEQTVGAIEAFAPYFAQASQAATSFDRTLLTMRKNNIGYKSGVFDLNDALMELKARFNAGETSMDIFDVRNAKMAEVLVANRTEFLRYTEAVTGSELALEQAAINTETNAQRLEQARNTYKLRLIDLGEMLAPVMTFSVNSMGYLIKAIIHTVNNWETYRSVLLKVIAVMLAYHARALATLAVTVAQNIALQQGIGLKIKDAVVTQAVILKEAALTGWRIKGVVAIKAASAAQAVLNVLARQFPGFMILAALTAIVAAIKHFTNNTKEAKRIQEEHNQALLTNAEALEKVRFRYAQLERINEKSKQLSIQGIQTLHNHTKAALENAQAQLALAKARQMEAEEAARQVTVWFEAWAFMKAKWLSNKEDLSYSIIYDRLVDEKAFKNGEKAAADFNDQLEELAKMIKSLTSNLDESEEALTAESKATDLASDSIANLEEKIRLYRIALRYAKAGSEDFIRIRKSLAITYQELDRLMAHEIQNLDQSVNAYQALTTAIGELKAAMMDHIARGQFDQAEEVNKTVVALENQKQVMDAIGQAGGSLEDFFARLDDVDTALLEEKELAMKQFMDNIVDHNAKGFKTEKEIWLEENMEKVAWLTWFIDWQIQQEQKLAAEKARLQKDIKAAILDSIFSVTNAGFQIFTQSEQHKTDVQIQNLNKQRDEILKNENLTEEQRQRATEHFRKKEAQIKRQAFVREQKAKIIMSIINTALAIAEANPSVPRMIAAGIAGVAQTALIAAQKVPQFAKGKNQPEPAQALKQPDTVLQYKKGKNTHLLHTMEEETHNTSTTHTHKKEIQSNVTRQYSRGKYFKVKGQDDGRTYNAKWIGRPKTGLYTRPSLFAEQGPEIIIDGPTTRKIRANHPEILKAIQHVRVKQYAEGKGMEIPATFNEQALFERLEKMDATMSSTEKVLAMLLLQGVKGHFSMTEFDRQKKNYDQIISLAKPS